MRPFSRCLHFSDGIKLFQHTFQSFFENISETMVVKSVFLGVDSWRQNGCQEVSVCLKFGSYPINSMKMEDPDTSLG